MARNPDHSESALAKEIFSSLSTMDALRESSGRSSERRIGFAEMYRYATEPDYAPSNVLEHALETDIDLRADFNRLLEKVSAIQFPAVAAASSGPLTSREAAGLKIDLKESAADSSQIYVIIGRLDSAIQMPKVLIVSTATGGFIKLALPDDADGGIQIMLDSESETVKALRDIDAVLFFR